MHCKRHLGWRTQIRLGQYTLQMPPRVAQAKLPGPICMSEQHPVCGRPFAFYKGNFENIQRMRSDRFFIFFFEILQGLRVAQAAVTECWP